MSSTSGTRTRRRVELERRLRDVNDDIGYADPFNQDLMDALLKEKTRSNRVVAGPQRSVYPRPAPAASKHESAVPTPCGSSGSQQRLDPPTVVVDVSNT